MNFKEIVKIDNLFIPIFILLMASGSIFFQDNKQLILLVGALGFFLYRRQIKVDMGLVDIIVLWVVINILSTTFINVGLPFSLVTVFSRLFLLLIVYFIIKLSGPEFYDKLNKHVFILTLISIPLFLIQILYPVIMFGLSSVFDPVTRLEFAKAGGWYSYIFMFSTWHPEQNCGFMWEPGAFAGFMVFMITYRLSQNEFKMDKYILVYLIGLLTSFSTAGFLALGVLLGAFFLKQRKHSALLLLLFPIIIYASYQFYTKSDFMSGKINTYLALGSEAWGKQEDGVYRTSRFGYAMIVVDESIHWPFGHGVINHSKFMIKKYGKIFGPGALSGILHEWGWIGLIGTIWFIFQFYRRWHEIGMSLIFTLAMCVILFSNPFNFLMLIYSIIFYQICFKEKSEFVALHD